MHSIYRINYLRMYQVRFVEDGLWKSWTDMVHFIKPPWIRGFFAPYISVFGQNTGDFQDFPVYFLNKFPVYHCTKILWIHVTNIPFYSFDMNVWECGKLYQYNKVYE